MSTGTRSTSAHGQRNGAVTMAAPTAANLEALVHIIEHAAHLLPAQGPINVFIHHNTLHAFEELPFDEAVQQAARVFGCQPYLAEDRYREELARGRIRIGDLETVLRRDLGASADEAILHLGRRFDIRMALLQYPLPSGSPEELLWYVAETDALKCIRNDVSLVNRNRLLAETRHWAMRDLRGRDVSVGHPLAALVRRLQGAQVEQWGEADWEAFTLQVLWCICCAGAAEVRLPGVDTVPLRHRDLLLAVTGQDSDVLVHDLLIRFCGAFLDQGLAQVPLPERGRGFYQAFLALYRRPLGPPEHWLRGLAPELARLQNISPLASIRESLDDLGVPEAEWPAFVSATLLALRGWGGMLHLLEERGDRAVQPPPRDSLIEFLAIRLLLDRFAVAATARRGLRYRGPLPQLRDELRRQLAPTPPPIEQRAFQIFQLAQVMGWTPGDLERLDSAGWTVLLGEAAAFPEIERRRVLHRAYERRFYCRTLDALVLHNRGPQREPKAPRFQAMFCIDEREESMRRHVEELAPDCATFGIAGFYFVGMYYRGAADAHFVPLCPVVMVPRHWVVEEAEDGVENLHQRRSSTRRLLGLASHQVHVGTRTFARGALLSAVLGVLATAPLLARTLLPRLTARIRRALGRIVLDPPPTHLHLERSADPPSLESGHIGFSVAEMTDMAERVLRDSGLCNGFSRLVVVLGHGSSSLNNPHASAYDCGACGGSRGGPNARSMAQILNDPRVRQTLRARGHDIPETTFVVGGWHNTCNDTIAYFDLERLPETHRAEFEAVRKTLAEACTRNAHERCRRFESAPLTLSVAAAHQHVEARSEDLAQPRPELGHVTNAITIVARRQRTRGLYLDRRAFLNSYDPTIDDADGTILTRILQAAVPVCSGISLEYFFSRVDNSGYGCGSKLPHNIASLLGVMDGAASDLRTGLPWQMVEIHEPVRSLFVIESTPETMLRIMERQPAIARMIRNGWIRLAVLAPHEPVVHMYLNGEFVRYDPQAEALPHAASSLDWYRGWRDHLEFAQIGTG